MASLYADNYATEPMSQASVAGIVCCRTFLYTSSAALVTADAIYLMQLPGADLPGFRFLGFVIDIPDLDQSNPTLAFTLGDEDDAARFVSLAAFGTIGTVAGRASSTAAVTTGSNTVLAGGVYGVLPKGYTANKNLILTVSTGAADFATGVIRGIGYYTQTKLAVV